MEATREENHENDSRIILTFLRKLVGPFIKLICQQVLQSLRCSLQKFPKERLHTSVRISDNFKYLHSFCSHIDLRLFELSNGEGSPLMGQF